MFMFKFIKEMFRFFSLAFSLRNVSDEELSEMIKEGELIIKKLEKIIEEHGIDPESICEPHEKTIIRLFQASIDGASKDARTKIIEDGIKEDREKHRLRKKKR